MSTATTKSSAAWEGSDEEVEASPFHEKVRAPRPSSAIPRSRSHPSANHAAPSSRPSPHRACDGPPSSAFRRFRTQERKTRPRGRAPWSAAERGNQPDKRMLRADSFGGSFNSVKSSAVEILRPRSQGHFVPLKETRTVAIPLLALAVIVSLGVPVSVATAVKLPEKVPKPLV